jgi:hypothetical protein
MKSVKVRYIVGVIAIVSMFLVAANILSAVVAWVWSML